MQLNMSVERKKNGKSIFSLLALVLLCATLIPLLASLLVWRFEYSGNSNRALGLAQIRNALDGATQLLKMNSDFDGRQPDRDSVARLKRFLNGPVSRIRIGQATGDEAATALRRLLPDDGLVFADTTILDASGTMRGSRNSDGSWLLTDAGLVRKAASAWDHLDEAERRTLANGRVSVQVSRDSSESVIRVGSTGYIWAISAAVQQGTSCFEVFHPQMEAVEVTKFVNSRGEKVGAEIASLRGRLKSDLNDEVFRYDYFWKNPEDLRERKKIVLMRYIEPWNLVLCAGLYEDEYFLPARTAETMFFLLILLIGCITLVFSFHFTGRISRALNTLANFSRLTAEAEGSVHSLARTGIHELDFLGGTMSDMEEKIIARERALKKELNERSILVEEVNHRVKNNLAVLAGIINLQRDGAVSEESKTLLSLLHSRVNSMALVYQQLIGANEFADLPFDQYIQGILAYHQSSRCVAIKPVARRVYLESINIKLDIAVPFGLIVNELVSNTYQHGLSKHRSPEVVVEFARDAGDLVFSISDNGEGVQPMPQEKTGFLLIRTLCSQLHGTFTLLSPADAAGGTLATVRVPR